VLLILGLTGGIIFGAVKLLTPSAPEQLLDLTVSDGPSKITAGESLSFTRSSTI